MISRVELAVKQAIERGYQVAPGAIELLESITTPANKGDEVNAQELLALVIEEKARLTVARDVRGNESQTISKQDLLQFVPTAVLKSTVSDEHVNDAGDFDIEIVSNSDRSDDITGEQEYSHLFRSRFEKILKIFLERSDARQLSRVADIKEPKGSYRVCGLVLGKRTLQNGVELVVDDLTGKLSAVGTSDVIKQAVGSVLPDQCVIVDVDSRNGRLRLKGVLQPDIPIRTFSTSKKRVYVAFLSDLHIGSKMFLEGSFKNFLEWLNGKDLSDGEEDIVERLAYLVIAGDIVDGVGVFPNQEFELVETDIIKQYDMATERLSMIPKHLKVIVIPGNHDSTRQALPQPSISRKYGGSLYELPNVTMLGDPSMFRLSGISILTFHGRSLDDVLAVTAGCSYARPTEAMRVLLKSRHLAPIFGSRTPIAPESQDRLVIEEVPDIFHCGHVHTVGAERYKGTLILNSGTWQGQTSYQKNLGVTPTPSIIPFVNLATMDVEFKRF